MRESEVAINLLFSLVHLLSAWIDGLVGAQGNRSNDGSISIHMRIGQRRKNAAHISTIEINRRKRLTFLSLYFEGDNLVPVLGICASARLLLVDRSERLSSIGRS